MCRNDPIVPSVTSLRKYWAGYRPVFIGPWDVAFGNHTNEWYQRFHNVTVMELVSEFFTFFGELEASKWVICPVAGMLLARCDIANRSRDLPACLDTYLEQYDIIKLDAPLHVQDPFEHCLNITKGLSEISLFEFQIKCRKAAAISENILKGEQTLNDLFQPIEITTDLIGDVYQTSNMEDDEVITLDDSDLSQDNEALISSEVEQDVKILKESEDTSDIEILGSSSRVVEITLDSPETDHDIEILSCDEEINSPMKTREKGEDKSMNGQSIPQSGNSANPSVENKQTCNKRKDISFTKVEGSSLSEESMDKSSVVYPVLVHKLERCSLFFLDYSQVPEFNITPNGDVLESGNSFFESIEIGQAACEIVQFALKQCLKMEVTILEKCPVEEKRKVLSQDDETSVPKRMKTEADKSVSLPAKYLKIAKYKCIATQALWNGRKKMAKKIIKKISENPLQYELAVTEAQSKEQAKLLGNCQFIFTVEVWQELNNPNFIHVTGNSLTNTKVSQSHMIPTFSYLSSLCKNLLKKLAYHVRHNMH